MVCSTVIIALLCEFTYVMLLFKHVLFKHKDLQASFFLVNTVDASVAENENQLSSRGSSHGLLVFWIEQYCCSLHMWSSS